MIASAKTLFANKSTLTGSRVYIFGQGTVKLITGTVVYGGKPRWTMVLGGPILMLGRGALLHLPGTVSI